jgi:hypothetical protein
MTAFLLLKAVTDNHPFAVPCSADVVVDNSKKVTGRR